MLIAERPSLARKAWKTSEPYGRSHSRPGPCSFSTIRTSLVAEDELQEEDHVGKHSFMPKATLHW